MRCVPSVARLSERDTRQPGVNPEGRAMNTINDSPVVVGAVEPISRPRTTDRLEQRAVEPSGRSTLRTDEESKSSAPVVQLVRKSAEQFSRLLETLKDATTAAALTGFDAAATGNAGRVVDTYA